MVKILIDVNETGSEEKIIDTLIKIQKMKNIESIFVKKSEKFPDLGMKMNEIWWKSCA